MFVNKLILTYKLKKVTYGENSTIGVYMECKNEKNLTCIGDERVTNWSLLLQKQCSACTLRSTTNKCRRPVDRTQQAGRQNSTGCNAETKSQYFKWCLVVDITQRMINKLSMIMKTEIQNGFAGASLSLPINKETCLKAPPYLVNKNSEEINSIVD